MKVHGSIKSQVNHRLCKNCQHKMVEEDGYILTPTKEEWICLGYKIIDPLDGQITYYSCRKARKDEKLCGPEAQWFKIKP